MNGMDKIFKEKLYDLETPLSGGVSFDKVMRRRKTPVWPVWWKPAVLVVATMSAVSLTGYFWIADHQGQSPAPNKGSKNIAANNNQHEAGKSAKNHNQENSDIQISTDQNQAEFNSGKAAKNAVIRVKSKTAEQNLETENKSNTSSYDGMNIFSELSAFGLRTYNNKGIDGLLNKLKIHFKDYSKDPLIPKPDFEFMFITGSKTSVPDLNAGYSIKGNHYFGQYNVTALWDAGRGVKIGAGLGFTQFKGFGEWNNRFTQNQTVVDTQYITIVQPGLPNKTITVYDTTNKTVTVVEKGDINYTFNKLSVPIAFRYYIGEGRTLWRINATVSPGMVSYSSGSIFNNVQSAELRNNQKNFSLDARVGLGVEMLMSKRLSVLIEPGLNYQMVSGASWKGFSRTTKGLGIGLIFKP